MLMRKREESNALCGSDDLKKVKIFMDVMMT
jgi:hypothetical protein